MNQRPHALAVARGHVGQATATMNERMKLPVIIVAVVALVAVAIFFGSKAMGAGDLDQGQVKYTPGTPPWMEKGGGEQGAPVGPSAIDNGSK